MAKFPQKCPPHLKAIKPPAPAAPPKPAPPQVVYLRENQLPPKPPAPINACPFCHFTW